MSNCPTCKEEITGFKDPRSIKEYKINGLCQECQDEIMGSDHKQICEECNKEIPVGKEIIMSNYAVCSNKCAMSLVGLEEYA